MPSIIVTASPPIKASVVAALRDLGLRNAGTPLEMASTPVSAADPEENARNSRNTRARPASECSSTISYPALAASRSAPMAKRMSPVRIMPSIEAMKMYTGMAKASPDSLTPRRFAAVTRTTMMIENSTGCSPTNGMAEPMLATPAAVETATVRM